jgi:hypothetical protein
MTTKDFCVLSEMLDTTKGKFKMSKETHKHIIGISGSIDPSTLNDSHLQTTFFGVRVTHDDSLGLGNVELKSRSNDDKVFLKISFD